MNTVYLLKNQHNEYLDKSGEWVVGDNQKSLFRSVYKDEALNQKAEFSVKNFELRITITEAEIDEKGRVILAEHEQQANILAEISENTNVELAVNDEECDGESNNDTHVNISLGEDTDLQTAELDLFGNTNYEHENSAQGMPSDIGDSLGANVIDSLEADIRDNSDTLDVSENEQEVETSEEQTAVDNATCLDNATEKTEIIADIPVNHEAEAEQGLILTEQKGTNLDSIAPEGDIIPQLPGDTMLKDDTLVENSSKTTISASDNSESGLNSESLFEKDASDDNSPLEQAIP
ncbi:hypothetical protein [Agarilytica rhodophyticola]|uniref:hypothetical protein n=1 Tax=Agarilytica rhodophyticola TaxID=1737490 RepID=UPI000B3427AD|nr:hypothetical protein [Agarilytica rhodophyticola]